MTLGMLMSDKKITIFVSALEPSANVHLRNLKKYLPANCELVGVCDSDLGHAIFTPNDFSIMGFIDVLKKIFFLKKAMKILSIESIKCDYVLLMDSSSFNLRLAKLIREKDSKTNKEKKINIMYYILPQVWAWKPWRAKVIESLCDKLACIWKFELHYYTHKARYVGAPLLDIYTQNDICQNYKDSKIFVFMPGSRASEIKRLMGEYRILIDSIKANYSWAKLRIIIPTKFQNTQKMELYGDLSDFEICYNTKDGLRDAHFAFVCAGTATLEAALMQIPFVLVYRARWLDYIIARSFVRLNFVGLANIIYQAMQMSQDSSIKKAGLGSDFLHEELIQNDCTAAKMLESYKHFDYQKYFANAKKLRAYLEHGSAENVAKWLLETP
ncbi:lipid-A-disaccharide synthase [Helicobacter saguini]|uniref:Lipid-A-disaccharide synthase n=2 Tax=Helicobacter saguini TaxID=1548018 RepID=A0A347W2Z0_9HELI|nr:lipid-A-disaccharide synthase [Helicobacter saguini]MWV66879.1 lipid-A-disaccharide synthase [Helicobacter saguini]MWV69228.1 lipid-A-disaccharide synthase [Helicobacter saguini]MWV71217.1 lipid-A-disaccharide synthase [Helicobacter saguini]TLD93309.1 lipid-A-disaccharide synthase [Helicobacter saguini]